MNPKWYFSTLLVLFTFLGTFQENTPVPNQEIVLEFNNTRTNDQEKEYTIANVKNTLTLVGASNIQIQKTTNGTLKISYYSAYNVAEIKNALSKKVAIDVKDTSKNKEENPVENKSNYIFDVYELTKGTDSSNFDGNSNSIIEIKYDSDSYTNPQNYASSIKELKIEANTLYKTKSQYFKHLFLVKNSTSHNKPEVRAGPNFL